MTSPSKPAKDADDDDKSMITQTLGGTSYSLRASPTQPWIKTLAKATMSVFAMPIMSPFIFLHSILMATPIRNTVISMFIPFVMSKVEKEFHEERQTLLEGTITDQCVVLDLGSGGGAYLRYCTKAKRVFAVEPVTAMHPKILQAGKDLKDLVILKDIDDIDPAVQFDVVILGNVLCEVPNVQDMLQDVDGRLKKGGKVYFSEHVGRPTGTWQRSCQNFVNPMWRHLSGGCNCNRDSVDYIRKMKDWNAISWTYDYFSVGMGPFVLGLAMKTKPAQ